MPLIVLFFSRTAAATNLPQWMKRLQIIDFTTILLFSNLLFKAVGRHPKTGKRRGGHQGTAFHNPCQRGSAFGHNIHLGYHQQLLHALANAPQRGRHNSHGPRLYRLWEIPGAYRRRVFYVTKVKKSLKYEVLEDTMCQTPDGLMEVRIQHVEFTKQQKGAKDIRHKARIISYCDVKKYELISLLTHDMDSVPEKIVTVYRKRWEIELLFKQIKQAL